MFRPKILIQLSESAIENIYLSEDMEVTLINPDEMEEMEEPLELGNYSAQVRNSDHIIRLLAEANQPILDYIREQGEERIREEQEEEEEERRRQEEEETANRVQLEETEEAERQAVIDAEEETILAAEQLMRTGVWRDNAIQFPRLLAELNMLGLDANQRRQLADSMNLPESRITELMSRATVAFQDLQNELPHGILAIVPGHGN